MQPLFLFNQNKGFLGLGKGIMVLLVKYIRLFESNPVKWSGGLGLQHTLASLLELLLLNRK